MLEIIGQLLAGLGLFFIGVSFIRTHLKQVTGRRFRMVVARVTSHPLLAAAWGVVAGAMMQSTVAVTFIVASLASAGLIQVRQALPILACSNIGSSVLVLLAALDLHLLILYLLGAVGLCHYFGIEGSSRYRHLIGALLGVGLLFLGLQFLKAEAAPLKEIHWFRLFLDSTRTSYALAFLVGGFLTFAAQSSSTVTIIAITLTKVGLLGVEQTIMLIYGTNLGSSLSLCFMGARLRGASRQTVFFQVLFKWVAIALFVPLFYLEIHAHVPLVRAFVSAVAIDLSHQMALVYLAFQIAPVLVMAPFLTPIDRWLRQFSPPTREEELSRPQFIYDKALGDAETAMDLVEQEQLRLLRRLPEMLDAVREEAPQTARVEPAALHAGSVAVAKEVAAFMTDLAGKNDSREALDRLLKLKTRNDLIGSLDESVYHLVQAVAAQYPSKALQPILQRFAEALHSLLLALVDAAEAPDAMHRDFLRLMTGDRGELMERIRRNFLRREGEFGYAEQQAFFTITSLFEQIVWLARRVAMTLDDAADPAAAGAS